MQMVRASFVVGVAVALGACGSDPAPADGGTTSTTEASGTSSSSASAESSTSSASEGSTSSASESTGSSSGGSTGSGPVASGSFELLTYNVAGLPQGISSSDPERYMPQISPLLDAFDVVVVQEDFWYHDELVTDVTHPYQSVPMFIDPVEKGIGDGLNRFSQFPFEPVERVRWYACNGTTDCSSDCLAKKGWSFSRTELGENTTVDLYNLHMEAGGCPEDLEIRTQAALDLADAIAERSSGRAVIVAGDFNLRASDPEDVEPLMLIFDGAGLSDACLVVECGDERIDKVLVRDGNRVALEVQGWRIPPEFVDADDGAPLSDHLPVAVQLGFGPT